VFCVPTANICY